MARFQYDKLSEHQLRIAIGLLNQEERVVEVLEEAVEHKINEVVSAFGISVGDITNPHSGGAPGGARAKVTKRAKVASNEAVKRARGRKPSSRFTISADQLASRQLQGRYLAAIRSVPKSKRGKYKSIAQGGDRQAAVDAIYKDYPPNK